ncbi:MAG: hypothetical protein ABW185_16385 [Sedimenticola sp.]
MPETQKGIEFNPGIRALSGQVEGVAESVTLDLLRAIDETVDSLERVRRNIASNYNQACWFIDQLNNLRVEAEIDPDESAETALTSAQKALGHLASDLKERCKSAHGDYQLKGPHEEAVVTAYNEAIEVACDLYKALEDIRVFIREHDADMSEYDERVFDNASDLLRALDEE